jgi:mannitol operon repressor
MKEELTQEQLNSTFDEIFRQSDRAAAVVSGGVLEEILQRMIISFLMPHSNVSKSMFEGLAPLSTFAAKIDISYHLGLINELEYEDLTLIKKIRNQFAHTIKSVNFETDSIKDRCLQLKTLNKTKPPQQILDNIKSVKLFFQINTTMLATILFDKSKNIKNLEPYKHT